MSNWKFLLALVLIRRNDLRWGYISLSFGALDSCGTFFNHFKREQASGSTSRTLICCFNPPAFLYALPHFRTCNTCNRVSAPTISSIAKWNTWRIKFDQKLSQFIPNSHLSIRTDESKEETKWKLQHVIKMCFPTCFTPFRDQLKKQCSGTNILARTKEDTLLHESNEGTIKLH